MSCSWQNAFTVFAGTLCCFIIYLFERLTNEKEHDDTFNNSFTLQMLGKAVVLFWKIFLNFFL